MSNARDIADSASTINYIDNVSSDVQSQINAKASLASPTFTGVTTVEALRDTVYSLTGTTLLASNGGIQTKVLSANTTFVDSLVSGDAIVLQLEGGSTYTVTWPTITWATSSGNVAPTLTAKNALVLWKVSSTLYGAVIGSYV